MYSPFKTNLFYPYYNINIGIYILRERKFTGEVVIKSFSFVILAWTLFLRTDNWGKRGFIGGGKSQIIYLFRIGNTFHKKMFHIIFLCSAKYPYRNTVNLWKNNETTYLVQIILYIFHMHV